VLPMVYYIVFFINTGSMGTKFIFLVKEISAREICVPCETSKCIFDFAFSFEKQNPTTWDLRRCTQKKKKSWQSVASVPMTHGAIASHFSPKLKKKRSRSRALAAEALGKGSLCESVALDVCFPASLRGAVKIYHGTLAHYREKCLPGIVGSL
jgi:hypothetical protein